MVSRNLRFRFTLVSYNILSQTLLNDHHYLYNACNPRDLEWPRRGHKIVKELLSNQADIICLQEVECEHLKSLYRPKLANYGYECLYKKKTGYKVDGCAIFYKSKLFHLLNYKGIEFNRTDVAHLLDRDNVGIIAILKPRIRTNSESSHLIIANTHLIFNPRRSDIKLAQLKFFLSELENFSMQTCRQSCDNSTTTTMTTTTASVEASQQAAASKAAGLERCQHPTILCGDLNSKPESEVSRYILKNTTFKMTPPPTVRPSDLERGVEADTKEENGTHVGEKKLDGSNTTLNMTPQEPQQQQGQQHQECPNGQRVSDSPEDLSEPMMCNYLADYDHSMKFNSVFPTHNRKGQKYVSTFSSEIVDYIFYTPKLRLESYKELLTEDELNDLGPIPNADFPSDHITLGAEFVLK